MSGGHHDVFRSIFGQHQISCNCILFCGTFSVSEHRLEPPEPKATLIWKLKVIRFLEKREGVHLQHIWQGLFGAPVPKPTSLLVIMSSACIQVFEKHH